ncbi:hypothetical protein DFH07DRAFT_937853 [Mycena maculata]|uniref:Uncharacterized protein n=1 Tax=Mycena maculata TaxID=230809 RepID=A0AAD7JVC1_9AGAR|nr:hypothetical protein DFH07DRAFT_937853 [Mycena maculata]
MAWTHGPEAVYVPWTRIHAHIACAAVRWSAARMQHKRERSESGTAQDNVGEVCPNFNSLQLTFRAWRSAQENEVLAAMRHYRSLVMWNARPPWMALTRRLADGFDRRAPAMGASWFCAGRAQQFTVAAHTRTALRRQQPPHVRRGPRIPECLGRQRTWTEENKTTGVQSVLARAWDTAESHDAQSALARREVLRMQMREDGLFTDLDSGPQRA